MEIDELEAAGVRPEWIARATTYEELNGGWPDAPYSASQGDQERDDVLAFLREAEDLIRMLSLFGLQRTATGWIVPPTLREFARAALQSAASRRYSTAF